jgi:3-oxoacyl-[acyl-carrier protein] reductase
VTLDGKVAVVTGGGSGIGEAICLRLGGDGARVAVLDVNEEGAARTAERIGGVAVRADVSESASVDTALAEVETALGPVDVWVNNAGIAAVQQAERVNPRTEQQLEEAFGSGAVETPLDALVRLPDDEWRRMLAVHLDGTFYGTRAAARSMAPRRTGSIVNIASICGIAGCTGFPHYSAAKGGILAFTRAAAKELIVQGIRVNAVAPGFIQTPTSAMMSDRLKTSLMLQVPLGRYGRAEEVAATVAFLARDESSLFVGETLSPNGGIITV